MQTQNTNQRVKSNALIMGDFKSLTCLCPGNLRKMKLLKLIMSKGRRCAPTCTVKTNNRVSFRKVSILIVSQIFSINLSQICWTQTNDGILTFQICSVPDSCPLGFSKKNQQWMDLWDLLKEPYIDGNCERLRGKGPQSIPRASLFL